VLVLLGFLSRLEETEETERAHQDPDVIQRGLRGGD